VLNGASSGMEAAATEILKTVQSDGSEIEMDAARPAVSSSVGSRWKRSGRIFDAS